MAKNQALKGILMGLADFAQNKADEVKYKSRLALTESKQRENWVWKLDQELKQQEKKNKMTSDMVNELRNRTNMGDLDIESPEVRVGEGGENKVYYPSDKDKEFRIKQGLNRISLKEKKGMALSPIEQKFKEEYSGLYDKEEKVLGKDKIVNLAIKLAQSETGGFATEDEINAKIPIAQKMLLGEIEQPKTYDQEQEQLIKDNMEAYGKSREEVIGALSKRGLL